MVGVKATTHQGPTGRTSRGRGRHRSRGRRLAALSSLGVGVLAVVGFAGGASGAAPASTVSPAILPKSTTGTFQEWNWDIAANDPGEHAVIPILIKLFESQYPKVHIVNTSMSLEDQNDKLPLAFASASSTPTLSQTNEGLENQGRLVTDGELLPLNAYNGIYHWFSKVGTLPLALNSWPSNKKMFGSGTVYGVPETGTVVGIFYNRAMLASVGAKPPTTWSMFTNDLALLAKAGKTPMAYAGGQPTAYQPTHVLWMLINHYVPAAQSIAFVSHLGQSPSVDTPGDVEAASTLATWTKDGYFPKGYQGLSDVAALNMFDAGKTGFFIEGNWYTSSVQSGLGAKAGFWAPPVVTGGPGEGWSIPTHSPNPNVAAALINDLLSPQIQGDLLKYGDIPAVAPSAAALASASPLLRSGAAAWSSRVKTNNLVPYMDWAYPDFLNQAMAGIAELQAGRTSASSLMSSLQSDYKSYWSQQG
jgi:raffinose/stachyose/melibiose transport system substrate-binding protein